MSVIADANYTWLKYSVSGSINHAVPGGASSGAVVTSGSLGAYSINEINIDPLGALWGGVSPSRHPQVIVASSAAESASPPPLLFTVYTIGGGSNKIKYTYSDSTVDILNSLTENGIASDAMAVNTGGVFAVHNTPAQTSRLMILFPPPTSIKTLVSTAILLNTGNAAGGAAVTIRQLSDPNAPTTPPGIATDLVFTSQSATGFVCTIVPASSGSLATKFKWEYRANSIGPFIATIEQVFPSFDFTGLLSPNTCYEVVGYCGNSLGYTQVSSVIVGRSESFGTLNPATGGGGEMPSTLVVAAPIITSPADTGSYVSGVAWSGSPSTATGTSPITWSLVGAPAGVSIHPSTGVISGTGAVPIGVYNVTKVASNGVLPNATQPYTLTIRPPVPVATLGSATTTSLVASATGCDPGATVTYTLVPGNHVQIHPCGTSATFSGLSSGTGYALTVKQTVNGVVSSASPAVNASTLTSNTSVLFVAPVGPFQLAATTTLSVQIVASGAAPYTYSVAAGVSTWASISPTGVLTINGAAAPSGNQVISVDVVGSGGASATLLIGVYVGTMQAFLTRVVAAGRSVVTRVFKVI